MPKICWSSIKVNLVLLLNKINMIAWTNDTVNVYYLMLQLSIITLYLLFDCWQTWSIYHKYWFHIAKIAVHQDISSNNTE